jgi:UDP-2-acetamido-3-amino-2,3-dideoxy-glucuronate N-acetyltransferase
MVFDGAMSSTGSAPPLDRPRLVHLPSFLDGRGELIPVEAGDSLPFVMARYFLVRDVPAGATRAEHAQRQGRELLSCVAGACTVAIRARGGEEETHRLEDPLSALYVPPGVWVECRDFSADAILLVACSHPYDPGDQITDPAEFESGPGANR